MEFARHYSEVWALLAFGRRAGDNATLQREVATLIAGHVFAPHSHIAASRRGAAYQMQLFGISHRKQQLLLNLALYHMATYGGSADTVQRIIDAGGDVNYKQHKERAALVGVACVHKQTHVLGVLIANGADIRADDDSVFLDFAVPNGNIEACDMLVRHGVPANTQDGMALDVAAENGHADLVQWLVLHGADLRTDGGDQAFQHACMRSEFTLAHIEFLLDHGVNEASLHWGLCMAFRNREGNDVASVVRLLMERGARCSVDEMSDMLCQAVNIELLLEYGAVVTCDAMCNAIRLADNSCRNKVSQADVEHILTIMIAHGGDVCANDNKPLRCAIKNNCTHIALFLIKMGANINSSGVVDAVLSWAIANDLHDIVVRIT